MENEYVLAMYDVRGKQEFIFRTNKIKEIIGGSLIIRDVFNDYLYPAAKKVYVQGRVCDNSINSKDHENKASEGLYTPKEGEEFSVEKFEEHVNKDDYIGEVIYDGGGNFFVLYKSKEVLISVNKLFTKSILKEIGTLRVLCSYIEGVDFDNYKSDEKKLREIHRINENEECISRPVNALPFVQMDPHTSMPIVKTEVGKIHGKNIPEKTTQESYAKLKKHSIIAGEHKDEYGEEVLDNLVKKKGEDSLLAVIFIDGNNMGAQVSKCLDKSEDNYDSCIRELRKFSNEIQESYVDNTMKAIKEKLDPVLRMVVFAGDEMSFVCRAEDAYKAVKTYFETINRENQVDGRHRSSCAGIAIFHSHSPYAEAYKIAEECCENGKKRMRENEEVEACYIDYQYCQSGLGMELETIRDTETKELVSKPWSYSGEYGKQAKEEEKISITDVENVAKALYKINGRTNVKGLVSAAKKSLLDFNLEMDRIYAHMKDEIKKDDQVKELFVNGSWWEKNPEKRRKLVYDIGIVYDLWFKDGEV